MARFVDANVFLYAFLRPRRRLKAHEVKLKELAKRIVSRIEAGEEAVTTTSHIAEVANILEDLMPLDSARRIVMGILLRDNVQVVGVTREDYVEALLVAGEHAVGLNDALAYVIMSRLGTSEVYSFDRHFDKLPNIRGVTR